MMSETCERARTSDWSLSVALGEELDGHVAAARIREDVELVGDRGGGDGAHRLRRSTDDGLVVVGEILPGEKTGRKEEVKVEILHLLRVTDDRVTLARRQRDVGLQVLLLLEAPGG